MRGGPDGADRLLVVHPERPDEAHGTERARRQPVRRPDERQVAERRDSRAPRRRERRAAASRASRRASRGSLPASPASREAAGRPPARLYAPRRAGSRRRRRRAVRSGSPTSSVNAGRSSSRISSSRAELGRVLEALAEAVLPSSRPVRRSLRYSTAQSASPGSTGSERAKTRFETPPVEVMTTTIRTCGWRTSTSTWRTVAVREPAPRRAREPGRLRSVSVVSWRAASSSLRAAARSRGDGPGRARGARAARLRRRRSGTSLRQDSSAEVCGCVSRPRRSSSARSPRTVDGDTVMLARATKIFEPTGWPFSTYSSTTRRRISRCRRSDPDFAVSHALCRNFRRPARP